MKKELYLPPESRVMVFSLYSGILSVAAGGGTFEDYEYEDLGTE